MKGYISRDLTDQEIGRLSQTSKLNHLEFNNSDFYTGLGQSKRDRFAQVKEFDLSQPQGKEELISYLTFTQNHQCIR